jgi:hypothetical protein
MGRPPDSAVEDAMRRFLSALAAIGLVLSIAAAPVAAGGPPSPGFYIDGSIYATVGTPTDFSGTGAPAHTYDRIYALGNGLRNVAEARPGDRDFNGGRWAVYPVTWNVAPVQLTSAEQVEAYDAAGWLTLADAPVRLFFCSVQRIRG